MRHSEGMFFWHQHAWHKSSKTAVALLILQHRFPQVWWNSVMPPRLTDSKASQSSPKLFFFQTLAVGIQFIPQSVVHPRRLVWRRNFPLDFFEIVSQGVTPLIADDHLTLIILDLDWPGGRLSA